MPKLNLRGDIVYGVSQNVGVFLNTGIHCATSVNANAGCWRTDDLVVFQGNAFSGLPKLFQSNVLGNNRITVENFGANKLWANNNGLFMSWLGGRGLTLPSGQLLPQAGFGDVGFDGTIAYKTIYQDNGGLTVINRGTYNIPVVFNISVLDTNRIAVFTGTKQLAYIENGLLTSRTIVWPITIGTIFDVDGETYICHNDEHYVLVYKLNDPTRGWKLGDPDHGFNPDAVQLGNDIKVTWSTGAGEFQNEIKWSVFPKTTPMIPFGDVPPVNGTKQHILDELGKISKQTNDLIVYVNREMK